MMIFGNGWFKTRFYFVWQKIWIQK